MQRRRDGVHMRQHRRVIGVLLEHHEDVHAPLLYVVLLVHPYVLRRSVSCRSFTRRSTGSPISLRAHRPAPIRNVRSFDPTTLRMFLVQPPCSGFGHMVERGLFYPSRKGKKAKRMPTTSAPARTTA